MVDYHPTAQFSRRDTVVVAYSARRIDLGPNGETHQAFVVLSHDGGSTWAQVPLIRTFLSRLRYWGFPIWPPEAIDKVVFDEEGLRIEFRDEWVIFEPGGESLWIGECSWKGLWSVKRVRELDYEKSDPPGSAPPIELNLLEGHERPPEAWLCRIAEGVGSNRELR